MSRSSGEEMGRSQVYSQTRAGPSKPSCGLSDGEEEDFDDEKYMRLREEDIIDIDDAITVILSSLSFEKSRNIVPTDRDDDALRRLHEKIFSIVTREPDDSRRRRLKRALPASNCVREQVFYLRRNPRSPSPSYFHRLSAALDTIVKDSFEEEYRKVATVLGLVEALAEVLILEVHAFGIPQSHHNEHRSIRKLIANALTNLTYGQIHSKRRLCAYSGFVKCVVRIIIDAPNVTQVYAGLVRNLSWMADAEMSDALRPTVQALSIAAVTANKNRDEGCVKATLSALWNLASHSPENKRTICDTPNCLPVLAALLTTDVRQTAIVDSATGILKYVSQYLANTSSHLDLRNILLTRLVALLGSSSFTIVTNTLGAIANLISKDPHLQNMIRHDMNAVQQLNVLRNSNREDIRSAVKNVLNAVNQPTGHTRFGEMSCSAHSGGGTVLPAEPMMHSHHTYTSSTLSPRLLPLRATRASPGRFMHPVSGIDQRSCSLPRHFKQDRQVTEERRIEESQEVEIESESAMGTRANSVRSLGSADPGSVMNTGGWNSTIDTAANSSRALSPVSFSELPASPTMCAQMFNFMPPHTATSSQECSEQATPVFAQIPINTQPMVSFAAHNTTRFSGSAGSANTVTRGGSESIASDGVRSVKSVEEQELESPDEILPGPSLDEEEGDYAIIGSIKPSEDLLTRSIQAEKPSSQKVSPRLNGFFSPPIGATSSSKAGDSDRLLMECIRSEMPSMESKNVAADRRTDDTIASRDSDPSGDRRMPVCRNEGSHLSRMESLESQASSEDSFGAGTRLVEGVGGGDQRTLVADVDTSIPLDCMEYDDYEDDEYYDDDFDATQFDEGVDRSHMTIDCSMISGGSGALATSTPKGSVSSIAKTATIRKTRLPVPQSRTRLPPKPKMLKRCYTNALVEQQSQSRDETIYVNAPGDDEQEEVDRIYMNAIKPADALSVGSVASSTKSAIVQPYNYQKPFMSRSNGEMSEKPQSASSVQSNPKQMLVTTV